MDLLTHGFRKGHASSFLVSEHRKFLCFL
jgi:hypothetical protein